MPMLSFELKHSPEYIEFGPTLKKVQFVFDYTNFSIALTKINLWKRKNYHFQGS